MKAKFFLLIDLLLGFCVGSMAQEPVSGNTGRYRLVTAAAEWQGDRLSLNFTCEVSQRLKSSQSLRIQPLYVVGDDTVCFPALGCYTESEARFRMRRQAFEAGGAEEEMVVLKGGAGQIGYQETVAVPSAGQGEIHLQYVLADCCSSRLLASEKISVPAPASAVVEGPAGRLPFPSAVLPVPLLEANVTFAVPEGEPEKERTATAAIHINYPVNRWEILPELGNNGAELKRLDQLFLPAAAVADTYAVRAVFIRGYASVEGPSAHNLRLSQNRAESLRRYLSGRYGLDGSIVSAEGRGENWEGLCKAVRQRRMADKEALLQIAGSHAESEDERERRLKEFRQGQPYRDLLQQVFPALRHIEAEIHYSVKPLGVVESQRVIYRRPQDLSLREMYEAARAGNSDLTLKLNRSGYGREYDIAATCFPDNDLANLNASSAALLRGDLEEAGLYLNRIKDNPLAANNLGVYYWLCNRLAEARMFFERARQTDAGRAAHNLQQLEEWEKQACRKEAGAE